MSIYHSIKMTIFLDPSWLKMTSCGMSVFQKRIKTTKNVFWTNPLASIYISELEEKQIVTPIHIYVHRYIGISGSFMAIYYAHNSPSSIWTHYFIPSIHDTFVCIYEQILNTDDRKHTCLLILLFIFYCITILTWLLYRKFSLLAWSRRLL